MLRAIRGLVIVAAFGLPLLLAACLNPDAIDDCHATFSCPLPDAGDGGDAAADH